MLLGIKGPEVVVGADDRAVEHGDTAYHILDAVVEFVVAETYGVVAHRVDGRDLEVSVQFGEVR